MTSKSEHTIDVREREAYIVGRPPRIPALKPEEIAKEDFDGINNIRKALDLPALTVLPDVRNVRAAPGTIPGSFRAWASASS